MAKPEHFIVKRETAWGTWVTPDTALRVDEVTQSMGLSLIEDRYSGTSRGKHHALVGAKEPTGSLSLPFWSEEMGVLLRAAQFTPTTTTPVGATTTREHGFLPNDSQDVESLSAQVQYNATLGVNLLGVAFDKLTISVKAKEKAMLAFDFVTKDEAKVGGVWDYDEQTASPGLVASPVYTAATVKPFIFKGVTLTTGGTPTLDGTKKFYTVAGGTARAHIDNIELTVENNLEARVTLGSKTPSSIVTGAREIAGKFDYVPADLDTAFYDEVRAGTQVTMQIEFLGPLIETSFYRAAVITLPLVAFRVADWPAIGGEKERRIRSIEFTALIDPTSGYDIGVLLRDTENAY